MKKIVFLFAFAISMGLVPACCPDPLPFWDLKNSAVGLVFFDPRSNQNSGTIKTDSVFVELQIDPVFIADAGFKNPFLSDAMAWDCFDNGSGFKGLKDKIVFMDFWSDSTFLGIPAGQTLREKIRFELGRNPLDSVAAARPDNFFFGAFLGMELIERPDSADANFHCLLVQESGDSTFVQSSVVHFRR